MALSPAAPRPRKARSRSIGAWFSVVVCLLLAGIVWLGFRQHDVQQRNNQLFLVLQAADPSGVKAALDAGADPNSVIAAGFTSGGLYSTLQQWLNEILHRNLTSTALIVAVSSHSPECVHLLLDRGANPNRPDSFGGTPLMWASLEGSGDIPIMQILLDKGADVNAKSASGETALGNSISENSYDGSVDLAVPRFLLVHGARADVEGRSSPGYTLLQWCVKDGNKNTVPLMNLLLDHGADPNQKDGLGWPILLRASQWITPEIVKSLLSHGANPNTDPNIDETPLMEAVRQDQASTIRLLLTKGAQVNVGGRDGPALSMAASQKRPDFVKLLLDHGADPNYINTFEMQEQVLVTSAYLNDIKSVDLLLVHGANVNGGNASGQTPLTAAAISSLAGSYRKRYGNLFIPSDPRSLFPVSSPSGTDVTQALLAAGANSNKADNAGNTALVYAVAGHNLPLVRLLLAYGASPTVCGNEVVPNNALESPLQLATERGYSNLLPLLQPSHH